MILRIEKHFKAEQAARKKAEELLQQAIGAEMDSKNSLEDVMKKRQQEQKLLEEERNAIKRVSACGRHWRHRHIGGTDTFTYGSGLKGPDMTCTTT